jgi:cytoskeleton-associated protein 5
LEEIIKTASVPKLAPSNNYSPILSLIKKLLADSNANVNIAAIKLSGVLVKGLRRNFS